MTRTLSTIGNHEEPSTVGEGNWMWRGSDAHQAFACEKPRSEAGSPGQGSAEAPEMCAQTNMSSPANDELLYMSKHGSHWLGQSGRARNAILLRNKSDVDVV